jgi:hypothetical protein
MDGKQWQRGKRCRCRYPFDDMDGFPRFLVPSLVGVSMGIDEMQMNRFTFSYGFLEQELRMIACLAHPECWKGLGREIR